ncbi:hypothetical protein BDR04DRAFT_1103071 [Suillus decipiens]|nr:hypothetical protein BDR04DRAFT_1103071 [Suillus decipiens]
MVQLWPSAHVGWPVPNGTLSRSAVRLRRVFVTVLCDSRTRLVKYHYLINRQTDTTLPTDPLCTPCHITMQLYHHTHPMHTISFHSPTRNQALNTAHNEPNLG